MKSKKYMFDDLLLEYESLEPTGKDAWNPLSSNRELWHRIRLFQSLQWALNQLSIPVENAKILDVGCGVGHSTRALLEFGVRPDNILGIDLRPSAIAYAQSVNPAITFKVVQESWDWPSSYQFDFCMQCTVFSSIMGKERRLALAQQMERSIIKTGLIFWWDRIMANDFAGGDLLDPAELFSSSTVIYSCLLPLYPVFSEASKYHGRTAAIISKVIQKLIGYRPTHCVSLLRKTNT